MATELAAKIARVLSDVKIAINVGEEDGVQYGNEVIVWRRVEINDPDTGDPLGDVLLRNLILEVSEVYPHFALARVRAEGPNPLGSIFKPSKVIVSSDRALDGERVELNVGDSVSVLISNTPLGPQSSATDA